MLSVYVMLINVYALHRQAHTQNGRSRQTGKSLFQTMAVTHTHTHRERERGRPNTNSVGIQIRFVCTCVDNGLSDTHKHTLDAGTSQGIRWTGHPHQ
mmetsp:Transcript_8531/g.24387  ORF Transcript_8531/g.24387 Transcript_8531/m.24387 type:complete len:97 (-) Transcript_8531:476-766(-)